MYKKKILEQYIKYFIISSISIVFFILIVLFGIIKFIDQLRKINEENYSISDIIVLTFSSLPKEIESLFPISILLGILIGLGRLKIYNELIIMQSILFSQIKITYAIIKTVIPLIILTMIIIEWVIPITENFTENYKIQNKIQNFLKKKKKIFGLKIKKNLFTLKILKIIK